MTRLLATNWDLTMLAVLKLLAELDKPYGRKRSGVPYLPAGPFTSAGQHGSGRVGDAELGGGERGLWTRFYQLTPAGCEKVPPG
jgi:hypothetical protein